MSVKENKVLGLLGLEGDVTTSNAADRVEAVKKALIEAKKTCLLGENVEEDIQVDQWLSFTRASVFSATSAGSLNAFLATRTYLVGQRLTLADVDVFATVADHVSLLHVDTVSHLCRWFDLMQHVLKAVPLQPLGFKTTGIPVPVVDVPVEVKKDKPAADKPAAEKSTTEKPAVVKPAIEKKDTLAPADKKDGKAEEKKDKKEKKEKPAVEAKPAAAEESKDASDPSKLDIRVGLVTKCWNHEGSEKLLCEEIDLGEGQPRQIASGIRLFYAAEQVQGRKVLVLANLKERSIAGFKSQGMVLCACNPDHTQVALVEVPEGANVGERIAFEGLPNGEAATPAQMVKKKILESLAPGLRTDENGVCRWTNAAFTVGGGVCRAPLVNATVS